MMLHMRPHTLLALTAFCVTPLGVGAARGENTTYANKIREMFKTCANSYRDKPDTAPFLKGSTLGENECSCAVGSGVSWIVLSNMRSSVGARTAAKAKDAAGETCYNVFSSSHDHEESRRVIVDTYISFRDGFASDAKAIKQVNGRLLDLMASCAMGALLFSQEVKSGNNGVTKRDVALLDSVGTQLVDICSRAFLE